MSVILSKKRDSAHAHVGLAAIWSEGHSKRVLSPRGMFRHHLHQAGRNVLSTPVTSFLTVLTIAVALSLLGLFLLLLEHVGSYLSQSQTKVSLSLYLKDETSQAELQQLKIAVSQDPQVAEVVLLTKAAALERFRETLGADAVLLEGLEENNPLPGSLEVRLKDSSERSLESMAARYQTNPLLARVQFNRNLAGQLQVLFVVLRRLGALALGIVLILCTFIISNTLKLALFSHRDEIEIMALVGANDSFVRAPYMIEGALTGMIGGILSLGVVYGVCVLIRNFLGAAQFLGTVAPDVHFLSFLSIVGILLCGAGVGLIGSFLTVRNYQSE